MKVKTEECSECMNDFEPKELQPYKYEPSRKVCMDCHDFLMDEDENYDYE